MTLHTGHLYTLLAAAMILVSASCVKEQSAAFSGSGKGKVMLYLRPEIEIKSTSALSDVDDYRFRFVGVGDYGSSEEYYRYGSVSWPMDWYFGVFRLEAENCSLSESEASYGSLRYYGISQPFTVMNGQTATASVLCSIANVKVLVNFDNAVFESFEDFKLTVESVAVPEDDADDASEEEILRSLDFNLVYKEGYYSVPDDAIYLKYTLFLKNFNAEEFIEYSSGYFVSDGQTAPAEVRAADAVTFNVKYVGDPISSPDIKFVVSGVRTSVGNEIVLEDYVNGSVTEDE